MRVLLVGSGGREHALAWKMAQSSLLSELFIAPGNPGTQQLGRNVSNEATNIALLIDFAKQERIELVVIGPEAALAAGLADALAARIPVLGPTMAAAKIESSKIFAKHIMAEAGIPTAHAHEFDRASDAIEFARSTRQPWVVKADGLASGKGVVVAEDVEQTLLAIQQLSSLGGGQRILLEQRLKGPEISMLALCSGERLLALAPARDHKRLKDGDQGPNTGGMGAIAPVALGEDDITYIIEQTMRPVLKVLTAARRPYCGVLYAGLILTEHGPRVLEYNSRFGDPEAQAVLPLIEGDLLAALAAAAGLGTQHFDEQMLGTSSASAACVVLASAGYPEQATHAVAIRGIEALNDPQVLVFHAATAFEEGQLVTAGGRVLGITGVGDTMQQALERAYVAIDDLQFDGMQYRRDIGI